MKTDVSSSRSQEHGFTLVEVIVAMFLLGILGIMVTTSIRVVARTSVGVTERVDSQQQARVALGALTRDIRLAARVNGVGTPPIRTAEAERMIFTATVDDLDLPALVQVERVSDGLRETEVVGRLDTNSNGDEVIVHDATPVTRYLARDVRDGDVPIFTYLGFDGAGDLVDLGDADGDVPSADLGRISLVQVSVTVKPNPNSSARATVLTSTVRLINERSR